MGLRNEPEQSNSFGNYEQHCKNIPLHLYLHWLSEYEQNYLENIVSKYKCLF